MPVGVWAVLHGLCFRKVRNLPTNLGLEVEFPLGTECQASAGRAFGPPGDTRLSDGPQNSWTA